jgi:hippurate hydrolase
MRDIVDGICTAHGAKVTVTYTHEFVTTINDPQCTADALAARILVEEHIAYPAALALVARGEVGLPQ